MSKIFTPSTNDLNDMISCAMVKFDADRKAALEDRAGAARAANKRTVRAGREAYLNQMPRARGYST
jgi:hypothetical protein